MGLRSQRQSHQGLKDNSELKMYIKCHANSLMGTKYNLDFRKKDFTNCTCYIEIRAISKLF